MGGTKEGGQKAAITNRAKYGDGFYARIGQIGGKNGHTGGFYGDPALARRAGALGGRMSKRPQGKTPPRRHPIVIPKPKSKLRRFFK